MVLMWQQGGFPGQPEVSPWADPEFAPVVGNAHKLVLGARSESLLAYNPASAAMVVAEVVARGLEPASTKPPNVEILKRSDSGGLKTEDRKSGFPDTILSVKAAELSWTELLAAAVKLKMDSSEWVKEGSEAKRFASLLVHFGGELEVPAEEEEVASEDEAEGLSLSQAAYDALVIEALDLKAADFSGKANNKTRAALLTRLVNAKRKRSPESSGSAKKAASESDLAAVSESVDMLQQMQAGDATRFEAQLQKVKDDFALQAKKSDTKEEYANGQMRIGMSTLAWQDDILRGQFNALEPLLKLAIESGELSLVKAIQEKIDVLVVANKKPDGTQLMLKVLAADVSAAEQKVENKFDVARKRAVQDAKDLKILNGYSPYDQYQAPPSSQQPVTFGGAGRGTFSQMGRGAALAPMARGQQLQLGGPPAPLQLGWQPPPGAMPPPAPGMMPPPPPGMMPPPGALAGAKAFLEPRSGSFLQGGSKVVNTMTGQAWPLRPMSAHNPNNPGQPVRGLTSPVRNPSDGARQECQICGEPAGPGGHLVFECPTARNWMQRGWVTDLSKPTPACPQVQ